jgi:hypothetical protein
MFLFLKRSQISVIAANKKALKIQQLILCRRKELGKDSSFEILQSCVYMAATSPSVRKVCPNGHKVCRVCNEFAISTPQK